VQGVTQGWALAYVLLSRRLAEVFLTFPEAAANEARGAVARASGLVGDEQTSAQRLALAKRVMSGEAEETVQQVSRQLAEASPAAAAAWHALGMRAARQGALADAAILLEAAADQDRDNARYMHHLCEVQRRRGRLKAALAAGRAAVQRQPDDAAAHYHLALALAEAGRAPEAMREYHLTLQQQPRHGRAWNNLGVLYWQANDHQAAERAFRQALAVAPELAEAQRNLAGLGVSSTPK
jgi:tetratricopeptide (TPR) repeat protein